MYEFIRGRRDYSDVKKALKESFTIVPLTNEVLIKAIEIYRDLRSRGESIDGRDLLIGATAIVHGVPLLSKNLSHYERLVRHGLRLAR